MDSDIVFQVFQMTKRIKFPLQLNSCRTEKHSHTQYASSGGGHDHSELIIITSKNSARDIAGTIQFTKSVYLRSHSEASLNNFCRHRSLALSIEHHTRRWPATLTAQVHLLKEQRLVIGRSSVLGITSS